MRFVLAFLILVATAFAIVPADVSRTSAVVDGHLGHQTLPGVPVWPVVDTVTLTGQIDNLTAAPSSFRIVWNGNDVDYGDMTFTQLDADSWSYSFVIAPLLLGHYELFVGDSGGEVRVDHFWSAYT